MNILNMQDDAKMTSVQIADLVIKRHDNVKRTIDNLVDKGVIRRPQIEEVRNHQEQFVKTYIFSGDQGKRDSIIVVAQLSPEFTAALVDRWAELENQVSAPVLPQSFAEALQLAADQAKALELAQPKINHYDRVVERSTLLNATQVAQKLGMSAQKLNKMLDAAHVYNRSVKRSRLFNTWFVEKGLGEIKQTPDGYTQALFTTKGEAWAIEHFGMEGA